MLAILSLILIIGVFTSFLPHIRHVWSRKDAGRISLNYLLLNLICSTESLFLAFFWTVNVRGIVPIWVHQPRNALDWINLTQLGGVWVMFNILFSLAVYYSPVSRAQKAKKIVIYILFLTISLIPMMIDATTNLFCFSGNVDCPVSERELIEPLLALHTNLIQPATVALLVLSFYEQARQPLIDMSSTGLKLQVLAFTFSAVCWVPRVHIPWEVILEEIPEPPFYVIIVVVFEMVGFAVSHDAIFAIGQAVLLWLVLRKTDEEASDAERQPLLDS